MAEIGRNGFLAFSGFLGHKVLTKVAVDYGLSKLLTPKAGEAPAGWQTSLQPWQGVIAGGVIGLLGTAIAWKAAPKYVVPIGLGVGLSFAHALLVRILEAANQAKAAQYLSGYEGSTAYQLGGSIGPMYATVTGGGMQGYGEYFEEPNPGMQGYGEYFENAGVSGFGEYGPNPDIAEAAAGVGNVMERDGIRPTDDLDHVLNVAEAAAGVGGMGAAPWQPYEANAGYGEYETNVGSQLVSVPRTDTWVPGMSDAPLWAGQRAITRGQAATAGTGAGILQTPGGQGVFG
jgi:hypothetical protein